MTEKEMEMFIEKMNENERQKRKKADRITGWLYLIAFGFAAIITMLTR